MKITCQSCQAKYTIADEKVAGKTVKIKCKKCGSTIVVSGLETAAPAPAAAYPGLPPMDDDGATRVVSVPEAGGAPTADEWTVNISDDDQRTMTTSQVAQGYASGTITVDTYLWRDGMADWLPLSGIPELTALVSRPGPAAGGGAPGHATDDDPAAGMQDNAATVALAQSPFSQPGAMEAFVASRAAPQPETDAAPAPVESAPAAAARRASAGRSGVDLFGGSPAQRADGGDMFPSPNAPSHDDRLVGERNENSVLFSLSSLTASDNASKAGRGGRDEAVIDMRPSAGAGPARRDVDDIMNLGGGGFASPILAPPSLLAPVVEPPPQPAPVGMSGSLPAQALGGMSIPPPKKGSMVGLIAGVALGIVIVGGAAIYFLRPPPPPAVAASDAPSASALVAAPPTPTATPTAAPSASAVAAAAPTESPSATPTATAAAVAAAAPGKGTDKPAGATPGPGAAASPASAPAKPEKTAEPAAPAAAAPAAGGAEFNRGAASSALGGAAGAAKSCKKPDGPTGTGRVRVTFAPSGRVTSAVVEGPPFSGTSVGGCIASAFRGAHIPPFDGAPVAVSKSFTIN